MCSLTRSGWNKRAHREALLGPFFDLNYFFFFNARIPFVRVFGNIKSGCFSLNPDTVWCTLAEFCSVVFLCAQFPHDKTLSSDWISERQMCRGEHPDNGEGTDWEMPGFHESQVSLPEALALHPVTRIEIPGRSEIGREHS